MPKKSFREQNPAEAYISVSQEEQEPVKEESPSPVTFPGLKPPKGYKVNHVFVETKSKRVQLLLQPSVFNAVKELAKEEDMSVNETVTIAILEYLNAKGKSV